MKGSGCRRKGIEFERDLVEQFRKAMPGAAVKRGCTTDLLHIQGPPGRLSKVFEKRGTIGEEEAPPLPLVIGFEMVMDFLSPAVPGPVPRCTASRSFVHLPAEYHLSAVTGNSVPGEGKSGV